MTERLERAPGDTVTTRGTKTVDERNREQGLAALETVTLAAGDAVRQLMDELRAYSIHCPNTPTLRGLVQDLQTREPVGLAGGRLPEAVGELLAASRDDAVLADVLEEVRELLDWASDFSAVPSSGVPLSPSAARSRMVVQFKDRFMAKGRNTLTGYDASEGRMTSSSARFWPCILKCLAALPSTMSIRRESATGHEAHAGDLRVVEPHGESAAVAPHGTQSGRARRTSSDRRRNSALYGRSGQQRAYGGRADRLERGVSSAAE